MVGGGWWVEEENLEKEDHVPNKKFESNRAKQGEIKMSFSMSLWQRVKSGNPLDR